MKTHQAQVYMKYLLFVCRRDILQKKKLNHHYYVALKKALFKPAGFFKGFLFPLCQQQCTLKEAVIIASILSKCSLPVLHASAAIMKLCQLPYSGATSIFLKTLIDKKFALPYKVVDAIVDHITSFTSGQMTVLWFQSFLVFSQRYKHDLSPTQRDRLLQTCKRHKHHLITPEIKKELKLVNRMAVDTPFVDVVMQT